MSGERHWLLVYEVAPDYLARRPEFRDAHLRLAWAAADRGDLVLAGAVGEPPTAAHIVFRTREAAAAFAKADPYVANGLVARWRVEPWATVVGKDAATPVRPADATAGGVARAANP